MSLQIFTKNNESVVSSLEIAEQLGVEHASTLKVIKEHLPKFELFGRVGFEIEPFETNGGTQKRTVFYLNESQAIFLGTLSRNSEKVVQFKAVLTKAFDEARKPRSLSTMDLLQLNIQAIEQLTAKTKELEFKIEKDQPKVEFYDKVRNAEGRVEMSMASKTLGIGRNKLFNLLRDKGILRYNNEPYQEYIDRKWFEILIEEYKTAFGETKIYNKTMVTPKGIQQLFKMIKA